MLFSFFVVKKALYWWCSYGMGLVVVAGWRVEGP
jgi:hypothetical protein